MLPKDPPPRTETGFSQETITPLTQQRQPDFSIGTALAQPEFEFDFNDPEAHIKRWTSQEVIAWMCACGIDSTVIECFELHDIDGAVLMDLEFEDLRELDIQSFGKRHQLWNAICNLHGGESTISPQPTPFQDISRPCTTDGIRSRSRSRTRSRNRNAVQSPADDSAITPTSGKKRRGRKPSKTLDVVTPAESVSIVAIEQLIPKPHKCAKGERCGKWRKQQREIQQLHDEHGIGRFPISPTKGGRIFVAGDPGNATTADNIVPNVHKQPEDFRPTSDAIPSVVASSDLLGPGQVPEFALLENSLERVEIRDPQDNVRQFLSFQHMQSPSDSPPTPPPEFLAAPGSIPRSGSVPLFPRQHHQAYPSLYPPQQTQAPHENLKSLPRLDIPRAATAQPGLNGIASPETVTSACRTAVSPFPPVRSATASPSQTLRNDTTSPMSAFYRLGTPASEMDVPVTSVPTGPVARDASQSVPPGMQYRQQTHLSRSQSTRVAPEWRRPSLALPAVKEGEVLSPISDPQTTKGSKKAVAKDPAKHSPDVKTFGYGEDCTHAGWMKKRKTKMLRHEWHDAHFRLKGTELAMHQSARLSSAAMDTINVENYAVDCSTDA